MLKNDIVKFPANIIFKSVYFKTTITTCFTYVVTLVSSKKDR